MVSSTYLHNKRFQVALSFAGEHRDFIEGVAENLSRILGQDRVFYDRYYEAELARPNLDTYLLKIYREDSSLIAIFLSSNYAQSNWCGLEWRAMRDIVSNKENIEIILFTFDEIKPEGMLSIDGCVRVSTRTPEEIASLILQRIDGKIASPLRSSQAKLTMTLDEVEVVLDIDLEDFPPEREQRFIQVLSLLLEDSEVRIRRKRPGNSLILTLDLTSQQWNILKEAIESGEFAEFKPKGLLVNGISIIDLQPPMMASDTPSVKPTVADTMIKAPELVCKIVATTVDGDYRGTGYPITPNRIITAAHVVDAAVKVEDNASERDARQIKILFGGNETEVEGLVSIEWSGASSGVDVAVLRCELEAAWQPGHELLTEPPKAFIEWYARGYTEYGESGRVGGKDAYYGRLMPFAEEEPVVALGCHEGLVSSQQWAGGSGSVAFLNSPTVHQALAVITDYQGGEKQDQLIAVPLNYLLNSDATREGFRQAIDFGAYLQRERDLDQCITTMTDLLSALQTEGLARLVAEDVRQQFSEGDNSGIDLESNRFAHQTAAYIVKHVEVMEATGYLFNLSKQVDRRDAVTIQEMMDHLLSFKYAPDIVRRLQAQVAYNQFGFVENAVATRTAAELIMAGYDQQPAKFVVLSDEDHSVLGHPALQPPAAPIPSNLYSDIDLLLAVREDLLALLREKNRVLGLRTRALQPRADNYDARGLEQEIRTYAMELHGSMNAFKRGELRGRRMYCLLTLPQEPEQRDFRKRVLQRICREVPDLVFVELMATPTNLRDYKRDYEVETYVQMRFLSGSQGQAS